MDFGIKERREELCMTQEELATKANVSRQTIWALETGRAKDVLVGTLASIATALGTTVDSFFVPKCSTDRTTGGE